MLGLMGEMASPKTANGMTAILFTIGLAYGAWFVLHRTWIGWKTKSTTSA